MVLVTGTWSRVLVVVQLLLAAVYALNLHPNTESNDVHPREDEDLYRDLPVCRGHSACAFLQANARGVNVQPFCICPGGRKCPLTWDLRDGHSLAQGSSDQYKFCDRVPSDVDRCSPVELAYTAMMGFSKTTDKLEVFTAHLHCSCPEHHVLQFFDMQDEVSDEHEIMISKYTCQKLKTCDPSEACREVSESGSYFQVKDVCACPHGLSCPSDPSLAFQSEVWNRGTLYTILCQ